MTLPDVAMSRDGNRAILVLAFDPEWYAVPNRHAGARLAEVRLAARAAPSDLRILVSGELKTYWNIPEQKYRWKDSFNEAFEDIALAGIGEHLDDAPPFSQPEDGTIAGEIWLKSQFLDLFARKPEQDDARLLRFVGSKLFWGYRLGLEFISFYRHDALRFGVTVKDLHHVAIQSEGVLWTRQPNGSYRALPRLLTDFRSGALPGHERPALEKVAELLDRVRYPGASHHLEKASAFLHGPDADLANAAKEAVSAVESVCKTLLDSPGDSLGDCIKSLRRQGLMPREIGRILESIYSYRNSTPGVGHGGVAIPVVPESEARLVLAMCAASIEYLDSLWPQLKGVDQRSDQ